MNANPLFPKIMESYRAHLRNQDITHLSLCKFCKSRGVNYPSVSQWMRRRGITPYSLECEVLLEQFGGDKDLVISELRSRRRPATQVACVARKTRIPDDKLLGHVSITFPDGLQIQIRETTPVALSRLIDLYNHELNVLYVRSK